MEALSQAGTSTGVPSSPVGTNTGTLALTGGTAVRTGERWKRAVRKLC